MFWWAASAILACGAQNPEVVDLLARLQPSLAYMGDARRPTGAAALVDGDKGLFLAHTDAVQGDTVQAKVGEWRVSLRVLGRDPRTGLVVLEMRGDAPKGLGPALDVADVDPQPGTKVCVLLPNGGALGTYAGGQKLLSMDKKPLIPVDEVRFETPSALAGGSLLVTFEGKLVGALGATVANPGKSSPLGLKALREVRSGFAAPGVGFKPGNLVVAYSPSLTLFRRSVDGLISDRHRTDYAALGIMVGDVPGGGAVIRFIVPDGPAARAKMETNDVLLAVGDRPIRRQIDFLQAMYAFKPGDRATVRVRHDGAERTYEVTMARSK